MNNYNNKINNNNIYLYICLIIIYIIYIYILYIIYIYIIYCLYMYMYMLHDFLFFCLIYLITTIKYYVNLYFYKHTSNINSYF